MYCTFQHPGVLPNCVLGSRPDPFLGGGEGGGGGGGAISISSGTLILLPGAQL